eukprot:XP_011446187.2 PREDICTED: adhesion G-protein coupled receptor D1-like [Crassostrea gigas]
MLLIDRHMKGHRTTGNTSDGVIRISPVLSLSAFKGEVSLNLEHSFTLRHYPSVVETINGNDGTKERGIECGYLDQQTRLWAYDGCFVLHTSPLNTTCFCNHTTNFAILMQVKEFEISSSHSMALNIVTYIGCTVSLITQLLAISVFSCLPSLNSERTCVHRNLCCAITAAQLLFLTGIKAVQIKFICSVVALLLHYFYSAVFVWMLVEGLLLYSKVVQVFGSEKSRIAYYYAFGWGVPLIIVVISATSNWSGYGTENSCWLSMANGAVWAFVGPAVSVIIVNMVILWLVVRIVINLERCDEYRQIRSGVKSAIFLLPLLGLTWIFGLLAVNKDTVIFQYIFAFLNSLQGFFIFLFHCVCNSEVRQAVKRMRERRVLSKQEFFNASETQNQSGGACSLKNEQMLGKPNGDDLRNVYPPLHMTSSTCISSNGNALLDNLKLEDVTRENDLVPRKREHPMRNGQPRRVLIVKIMTKRKKTVKLTQSRLPVATLCNMVSFQQSFATCVGILTILSFCQCSQYSYADELLQKNENSKLGVKKLAALLANELLSEDKDITQKDKRVFCNGFFGCSNGKKRSNSMNLNPLDYPVDAPEPETKTDFRKRLFCNTGGCFGRRKRSTSQTLERRLNNRGSKDGNQ